jgi:hypothetical protein
VPEQDDVIIELADIFYYRQTVCRKTILLEDTVPLKEDHPFILEAHCSIKDSYENPRGTSYHFE